MILVTGGTGLLGSNLLFELCKSNTSILAIYRNEAKIRLVKNLFEKLDFHNGYNNFLKIKWVQCDILDISKLSELVQMCSHIYHCAAKVSFVRRDFSGMMKVNGQGTANIVNCALDCKIEKFCHVSSTSAVGKIKKNNFDFVIESNKWTQNLNTSGYAISKYTAEKEVWRGIEEGLNAVIINPSVIFGPGDWDESSLSIFKTLKNGMIFYTKGSNAFVDVRDVCFAMIKLMNSNINSQRFLCTGTNISFKELFDKISKALNKNAPYIFANKFLSGIAWRLASLISFFGRKTTLTKESVHSSQSLVLYDSSKIMKELKFNFKNFNETINYTIKNKL
jgi:nucleoside-diphosphate-sugar epimerase